MGHSVTDADADVLTERRGAVGVVTINRPARLNALPPAAVDALRSAFLELEADGEIRAVILTGQGRAFCAGADISGTVGNARDLLVTSWNPLISTMRALQLPIVAAVNGVAAGAGVSLALACDLRVAATAATFELSFAKIGLMPDAGLTWLLPRVIGLGRASELALLARRLPAGDAAEWGLVNELAEADELLSVAEATAARCAELSASLATIKAAFARGLQVGLDDQLHYEAEMQGGLQSRPDFTEAIRAFGEKRPARFGPRTEPVRHRDHR